MSSPTRFDSRRNAPFRVGALSFAVMALLAGCFCGAGTFYTVFFDGHVRRMDDSTAIPGALVLIDNLSLASKAVQLYTDSTGAYSYSVTWPSRNWDPLNIQVIVADCDGWENGLFLTRDTLLLHENSQGESRVYFLIDFYMEMVP